MRNIVLLVIVACIIAGMVPRFASRFTGAGLRSGAEDHVAAVQARPEAPRSAGPRTVTIRRGNTGGFEIEGAIDGRRLDFIVDTGASVVTLNSRDAERLGYHPAQRDYTVRISTA